MITSPKQFHIDKRASAIAAVEGDDDELLSTNQVALWLGVSVQWVEIGRHRGYGPSFERLGARCIRYRRGNVRKWLDERSHCSTAEYRRKGDEAAR
jgi:predicted DNA-binding transcriptional regulator AlpA